MINCDKGHLTMKGSGLTIFAEFSTIAHGICEFMEEANIPKEGAERELKRAVDFALAGYKERPVAAAEAKGKRWEAMEKLLAEVLGND